VHDSAPAGSSRAACVSLCCRVLVVSAPVPLCLSPLPLVVSRRVVGVCAARRCLSLPSPCDFDAGSAPPQPTGPVAAGAEPTNSRLQVSGPAKTILVQDLYLVVFFLVFFTKDRLSNMVEEPERATLSVRHGRCEGRTAQQCAVPLRSSPAMIAPTVNALRRHGATLLQQRRPRLRRPSV